MNILITGANGFIGKRLITSLQTYSDIQIYALSRYDIHIGNVISIKCDVLNKTEVETVFAANHFDTVIHLAAITAHEEIVGNRVKAFETNLYGTMNILNSFNRHCKNAQFIYASTGKVYGKTNEMPITEQAVTNPLNILGKTKRITEQVIDFYASQENRYLNCRIFNIYGEFQKRNFLLPTIIDQLDKPFVTLGALKDYRDYLYIDDLLSAIQLCVVNPKKFASVDYINIGSGEPTCVADILRELEQLLNRKIEIHTDVSRFRKDETPVEFCSNEKLWKLVGWKPLFSLHNGLEKALLAEGVLTSCKQ